MNSKPREILIENLRALLDDDRKQLQVSLRAKEKGHRISQQYISMLVRGERDRPSHEIMEALAAGLDVEFHELFLPGMAEARAAPNKRRRANS